MAKNNFSELLSHGRKLKESFDNLAENALLTEDLITDICNWLKDCINYGRFLPDPSPDRRALQGRVDYWTSLLSRHGFPLPEIDRLADFDPTAGFPLDIPFPFPGLTAYSEKERTFFCGRDHDIKKGVTHLEQYNALLLVSESGGGKSSLAMAGILPQLAEVHTDWLFAPRMTPGAHPVKALSNALCTVLPALPADFSVVAGTEEAALVTVQPVVEALDGRTLVLFIDQLEELLTLCIDSQQQAAFSALVCALVGSGNCHVLATMRMDYQDQLAKSQSCLDLYKLLAANDGVKTLAPLGFDAIRNAILKPAQEVGLRFVPPENIDELAKQTSNLAGGLPLLQFALWRLWESRPERDGNKLDLINKGQIEALPSVQMALGKAAEAQYKDLPEPSQKVCKRLMLELTILAATFQEPMRRRRLESEVVNLLVRYENANRENVEALIDDFVKAKLLVRTGEGENTQLEVAHEAIFRNWNTFDNWVSGEETKTRLRAIRLIGQEAALWTAQDQKKDDYLKLKGEPLEGALGYEKGGWLDEASCLYVQSCYKEEQRRREEDRRRREEKERALEEKERALEREKQALREKERAIEDKGCAIEREKRAINNENRARNKLRIYKIMGVFFVSLLVIGLVYLWNQQETLKGRATAAASNLMSLNSQLKPWDALDLTYTLQQKLGKYADFSAPLAHALDRMKNTQMLGDMKNRKAENGINFTASGRAVIQFQRNEKNSSEQQLNIYLVDEKSGMPSKNSALIDLGDSTQRYLRQVEVGPIEKARNTRLALLAFKKELQSGVEIHGYRILASDGEKQYKAESLGDPIHLDENELSEISFDASGQFAVLAAKEQIDPNQPPTKSRVILFGVQDGKKLEKRYIDPPQKISDTNIKEIVTEVAFRGDQSTASKDMIESVTWDSLVTGRLNGKIYCKEDRLIPKNDSDNPPVDLLRIAPGTNRVVARRQGGEIIIRDCDSNKIASIPRASDVIPQSIMHRNIEPGKTRLTYVEADSLRCLDVQDTNDTLTTKSCGDTPSLPIVQAVPMSDRNSILVIEDRLTPAVFTLKADTAVRKVNDKTRHINMAGNASVSWTPAIGKQPSFCSAGPQGTINYNKDNALALSVKGQNIFTAAVSPNGKYVVWIEFCDQDNQTTRILYRWAHNVISPLKSHPSQSYGAVAVNDKGEVAATVVDTVTGTTQYKLFFYASDGSEKPPQLLPALGQCVAFSHDGQMTLVGDANSNTYLYDENLKRIGTDPPKDRPTNRGTPVSCAVSDNGTAVIGLNDGQVLFQKRGEATLKPISELVLFRLAKEVRAVSIDHTGRFVAALGEPQFGNCLRAVMGGQNVRLWDLDYLYPYSNNPKSDMPRLSTCFPGSDIKALGVPSQNDDKSWVLPLYKKKSTSTDNLDSLEVDYYPCMACAHDGKEELEDVMNRINIQANQYKPQKLDDERIKALYGIEIE